MAGLPRTSGVVPRGWRSLFFFFFLGVVHEISRRRSGWAVVLMETTACPDNTKEEKEKEDPSLHISTESLLETYPDTNTCVDICLASRVALAYPSACRRICRCGEDFHASEASDRGKQKEKEKKKRKRRWRL